MGSGRVFRQLPAASRQRGLPALGVELTAPDEVDVEPVGGASSTVLRCVQRGGDGALVGALEVGVFAAALIIDRDGILENKARAMITDAANGQPADLQDVIAVSLPGAVGYRVDAIVHAAGAALPHVCVMALASHDLGIDGGVLVTVRSADAAWPAAERIARSLRILTRAGTAKIVRDDDGDGSGTGGLPVLG